MSYLNFIKRLSLAISLLILTSCNSESAKESLRIAKEKGYVNYEVLDDSVIYHYIYRSGVNYYMGEAASFTVKEVDPKTLVELTQNYAKDKSHVFHKGHKLIKRDSKSFRVLDKLITADKYGAYMDNKIIKGSHGPSFKFIGRQYGVDNNQMYYLAGNFYRVLKGVDTKTAKIVECDSCSDRYVVDKKHVYYQGELMKAVNVKAFEVISDHYSKDDAHIFYGAQRIKSADYPSFHMLKQSKQKGKVRFTAADKNNEYGVGHYHQLIVHKKK